MTDFALEVSIGAIPSPFQGQVWEEGEAHESPCASK